MLKIIILPVAFMAIVYGYSFIKIKKSREKTKNINSIQKFHDNYRHLIDKSIPEKPGRRDERYQYYVTKYNSHEDYREKR